MKYDLVVLGGGPAGYTGALRAAKLGMSVALIECAQLGGTCLNRGCIPTKSLLRSSALYAGRSGWAELGVKAADVAFSEAAAYARKDSVVERLRRGIAGLIKAGGIELINCRGSIVDERTVECGGRYVSFDNLLIATGSRPAVLPIEGMEGAPDSDTVLAAPVAGSEIAIIGGGVIGVELATYFGETGRSVTIVEAAERILPMFSQELSIQCGAALKKRGVKVMTSARVIRAEEKSLIYQIGGVNETMVCDTIVSAAGRRPNVENIGLENIGLGGGYIPVDEQMRTACPGVYAAGDVTGGIQLAHYAAASAVVAVDAMLGRTASADLSVVPSCVYSHPEIAVVGEVSGYAKSGKFLLGANGKYLIDGSDRGFVKVFCDSDNVITGAEVFADGATELIAELALAVKNRLTAEEVAATVHAHPTVSESVAEACEDVFGLATHIARK